MAEDISIFFNKNYYLREVGCDSLHFQYNFCFLSYRFLFVCSPVESYQVSLGKSVTWEMHSKECDIGQCCQRVNPLEQHDHSVTEWYNLKHHCMHSSSLTKMSLCACTLKLKFLHGKYSELKYAIFILYWEIPVSYLEKVKNDTLTMEKDLTGFHKGKLIPNLKPNAHIPRHIRLFKYLLEFPILLLFTPFLSTLLFTLLLSEIKYIYSWNLYK